ncbi:MAG: hypothetical protein KF893_01545 [Caldilineaceae bacterium]|nr:hypothetical protein [Caldilineaceae bacterium]
MSGKIHVRMLYTLPLVLLMLLLLASAVWAGEPEEEPGGSGEPVGETSAAAVSGPYDDGGNWELGIHGTAGDLTAATAAERAGMSYWLAPASNWTQRYSFAESGSWEKDFKRDNVTPSGWENSYIDSVDLQFYVGHGWPGGFTFFNSSYNDGSLVPNDCYRSWGDRDNEWLALTSCQVLADSNLGNWAACMYGQHLIMGFVTNASAYNNASSTQAYHFGRYIMQNYTMPQAWYKACDVAQRGRITRTIINELDCLNDKPNYGQVCADSYDWDWWYQTHSCGTETALYVPSQDIQQLPVFKAKALTLQEADNRFATLGETFGLPTTPTVQAAGLGQDDSNFYITEVNSRTLEMDKVSGLFNYSDLNALWTTDQAVRAMSVSAASPNYISQDDARQIADAFLRNSKLGASDAVFYEVISDTISSEIITTTLTAAALDDVEEFPILWQVIYSRRLHAQTINAAGVMQEQEFSVVGSGAKQKVYVPVAAEVGAADILQTQPNGVQGGWRQIEQAVDAATGEALYTTILTAEEVKALYLALLDKVALNDLPIEVKSREILTHTIAYWEEPVGVDQGEFIPVYELKLKLVEAQSDAVVEDFVYVPASPIYMRPVAKILDAPTEPINAGTAISLTAADASKSLKELGFGDFNIVLGSGDPTDYQYDWYLDGELIESGPALNNFVIPFSADNRALSVTIELRVKDIRSPNTNTVATDKAVITSDLGIFLPTVTR